MASFPEAIEPAIGQYVAPRDFNAENVFATLMEQQPEARDNCTVHWHQPREGKPTIGCARPIHDDAHQWHGEDRVYARLKYCGIDQQGVPGKKWIITSCQCREERTRECDAKRRDIPVEYCTGVNCDAFHAFTSRRGPDPIQAPRDRRPDDYGKSRRHELVGS